MSEPHYPEVPHQAVELDAYKHARTEQKLKAWAWLYEALDNLPEGKCLVIDTTRWRQANYMRRMGGYYFDAVRDALRRKYKDLGPWTVRLQETNVYIYRKTDAALAKIPHDLSRVDALTATDEIVPAIHIEDDTREAKGPTVKEAIDQINAKLDAVFKALSSPLS